MVWYFYKLTPLFLIGTLFILALPWLGLIALVVVALIVLAVLGWAIVYVPYKLGRAVTRSLQGHGVAHPQPVAALTVPTRHPDFRSGHAA